MRLTPTDGTATRRRYRDESRFSRAGSTGDSPVLKWIIEDIDGTAADVAEHTDVENAERKVDLPLTREWFGKIGERLPAQLVAQLADLQPGWQAR